MVHHYMVAKEFEKHKNYLIDLMKETELCSRTAIQVNKELSDLKINYEAKMKEIEIIKEKIMNQTLRNDKLNEKLKDLDSKMKTAKEMIDNAKIIAPIIIEDEKDWNYDLTNGLVNVNRNVVMRLLRMIGNLTKIKTILGMGEIFYIWSKQPIFCWVRNALKHPLRFVNNPLADVSIKENHDVIFGNLASMVVDVLLEGRSKLIISVSHVGGIPFGIGVVPSNSINQLLGENINPAYSEQYDIPFSTQRRSCAAMYAINYNSAKILKCDGGQIDLGFFGSVSYNRRVLLAAELNTNRRTLHFFKDGAIARGCIVGVPQNCRFMFSGYNHTVNIVSLGRLSVCDEDVDGKDIKELKWN